MEEYHPMTMTMMVSSPPLDPSAVCFQPTAVAVTNFLPLVTVDHLCFQYLYSSPLPPACLPHQLYAHPPPFFPEFLHAPPPPVYYYYYYSPPPLPSAVHDEKRMMSSSVRVTKKWIPKNRLKIRNSEREISQKAIKEVKANLKSQTTLMIRNIPNQLKREDLQRLLDDHCMVENKICRSKKGSAYDFLYLPMDFVFKLNLGYAFVNFTTPEAAARFFIRANKFEWSQEGKTKICEICVADYQGKYALRKRFKNSVFECDSEQYMPAVYSPPRDGSVWSPPVTLGRCTGRPPARQGGSMVMPWRKMRCGLN